MNLRTALAAVALGLASTHARAQETNTTPNELPPEEAKPKVQPGIVLPTSIMGGIRVGGALNAGKNAPDSESNPNGAIAGVDLALEVGALVFDHFYGGILGGGTLFVSPQSTTSNVSSFLFATEFGYLTNPRGFGAFFGLGIGYRAIFVSDSQGNANKFDGVEGLATLALHVRIGDFARLLPRVDFSVGPSGPGNVHAIFIFGASIWLNDDLIPKKRHASP
jgi:hypothetical protein